MSKLNRAFQNGKVFMAFLTCGDPDLATTDKAIQAAVAGGADIIELNIPFSDPTAVDPVIQEANVRALAGGITTDDIFAFVKRIRASVPVPIVFSSYANVVFSYGAERFIRNCQEAGVDGLLVPDVPFEERQEFMPLCKQYGIPLILMVAVTSRERVVAISKEAEGFLYIMGCPGNREEELLQMMALVRSNTDVPCVICLHGTESYRIQDVAKQTDGVAEDVPIVGLMQQYGADSPAYIEDYIRQMKEELKAK